MEGRWSERSGSGTSGTLTLSTRSMLVDLLSRQIHMLRDLLKSVSCSIGRIF